LRKSRGNQEVSIERTTIVKCLLTEQGFAVEILRHIGSSRLFRMRILGGGRPLTLPIRNEKAFRPADVFLCAESAINRVTSNQ
jgi:hypothetical protein